MEAAKKMVRSMTTFAKVHREGDNWSVAMELRSVNSRYCDVYIRMPKWMIELEDRVRRKVKECLERGRIELGVQFEAADLETNAFEADMATSKTFFEAASQIKKGLGLPGELDIGRFLYVCRDAIRPVETDADLEIVWQRIKPALLELLDKAVEMSSEEGANLVRDLEKRLMFIEKGLEGIERRAQEHTKEAQKALRERVQQLLEDLPLDENRIAAEAAILADRLDITEEIVRARSHLAQFRKYLSQGGAIGRRLDFLLQEFFREINTMGSKSADQEISKLVVEIKGELEKIREQIQNLV